MTDNPTPDEAKARMIAVARDGARIAVARLHLALVTMCPGPHNPVQHRDHKPPWCQVCRYTTGGEHIPERSDR